MIMDTDSGSSDDSVLSADGLDLNNYTVAFDFLQDILADDDFQSYDLEITRAHWYGVVVFIAIVGVFNYSRRYALYQRRKDAAHLRSASKAACAVARPTNFFSRIIAGFVAAGRELSYTQLPPFKQVWFPATGTIILLITYLCFTMGLEYFNVFIDGAQKLQSRGIRAGWIAIAQFPLVVLLAGRQNLIGYATGLSYDRLRILHRWVARIMFLFACMHWGYQSVQWNEYGLVSMEWTTDACPPTGVAAWALLFWMNVSTLAPFRNMAYEIFIIQHVIVFFGFIVAVVIHLPVIYSRVYVYLPIGLWLFDRVARVAVTILQNRTLATAHITVLPGDEVVELNITAPTFKTYSAGQHVYLNFPRLRFWQSHPFTVVKSSPGELTLFVQVRKGFTKQLLKYDGKKFTAILDGPYGGTQSDISGFDSAVLISGGTGITFALSQLSDLAARVSRGEVNALRRISIIWSVKNKEWTKPVQDAITSSMFTLQSSDIDVTFDLYVTQGATAIESVSSDADSLAPENKHLSSRMSTHVGRIAQATDFIVPTICNAHGETGVFVCGPVEMESDVRNSVASVSDALGVHKGGKAHGIYLHCESFRW
ncbi:ferric reductase like transmembrane component-domain-containing protein [Limtongia smithiae]|uniref:ferric reductase like transmembrane component-domain-containing protein n=1 Tax=Limtongia smithiae TaxID=1125753 RepID=UPI0034CE5547